MFFSNRGSVITSIQEIPARLQHVLAVARNFRSLVAYEQIDIALVGNVERVRLGAIEGAVNASEICSANWADQRKKIPFHN